MNPSPIYTYKKENLAPISVCLIAKNEQVYLEKCLQSIRPYVKEIIVVDTGSTDSTPEIAKKYADIFEIYTECNDENGLIEDFSLARSRSFDLATQPWILWIDADDEVLGAENLINIIAEYNNTDACIAFPYQYSFDEFGKCTCLHYRERLINKRKNFKWVNPVHEVLSPVDGVQFNLTIKENVIIKHNRDITKKPIEVNRNLRIIQKYYDKVGEKDVRQLYYLGLEYGNVGNINESIKFLNRYLELSGWDDEKYMALMRLIEYYLKMGYYDEVLSHCWKAILLKPDWGEAYFNLAKAHYFLANKGEDPNKNWEKCIIYANIGLSLPPTKTLLFINPAERNVEIHRYLNVALSNVNKISEALNSVLEALKNAPTDSQLLNNKSIYETALLKDNFFEIINELESKNIINTNIKDTMLSLLENKAITLQIEEEEFNSSKFKDKVDEIKNNFEINIFGQANNLDSNFLVKSYNLIWKHLLLHDEIIHASKLLESVPWQIRNRDEIKKMKKFSKSLLDNLLNPEIYKNHYSKYATLEESHKLPENFNPHHTQFARYNYVVNFLSDKKDIKYLDIGSHDGWLTNRIGLINQNIEIFGIEASENGANLANQKALEFNTKAQHARVMFGSDDLPENFPKKFDVITALEIYEHVPNTIDLINNIYNILSDDGYLILSTPKGSWCQGKEVSFHPAWNSNTFKEHVRAPIKQDLEEDLNKCGFKIVDYQEIEIDQSAMLPEYRIDGQKSICLIAKKNILEINDSNSNKNIVFYVGRSVESWNPRTAKEKGIGGSETAVIEVAKRLSKKGNQVRVFGDCIRDSTNLEGHFDGVEYLHYEKFKNIKCDILITSRTPISVDKNFNCEADYVYCWVHDIHCGSQLTFDRYAKINKFLCLSDWHRDFFINSYPFMNSEKVVKTRNGINLERFDKKIERNMHRAIYSSSPDRGMQVVVQNWKRIREQIPDAELHIFYGFQTWESSANKEHLELIQRLKQLLKDNEQYGVYYHGRVSQEQLAEEMLKSNVWAYSTWFSETSCCYPDTLISIPGDHRNGPPRIKIKELVGKENFPVYCFDEENQKFTIGTCKKVWESKIAKKLVKITLDDNSVLKLTPEHKVLNFDGIWKDAQDLKENDRLMALHHRYNVMIKDFSGNWINESKLVAEWKENRSLDKNEHVDHLDPLRLDNRPESLQVLSASEHARKTHKNNTQSALTKKKRIQSFKETAKTDEFKNKVSNNNSKKAKKFWDEIYPNYSEEEKKNFIEKRTLKTQKTLKLKKETDPEFAKKIKQSQINGGIALQNKIKQMTQEEFVEFEKNRKEKQKIGIEKRHQNYGKNHRIISIEIIEEETPVYDMEVEKYHNFIAEGVVVHNCITAMESQAAGLHIVTSPIAALNETVGERGVLISGDWLSQEYADKFVEEVVKAMLNPMSDEQRDDLKQYAKNNFSWDGLVESWEKMFDIDLSLKSSDILEPYKPIL